MHGNVTTMHVSSNVTSGIPTDKTSSPDGPHPPPASTMPPKAHIPTDPSMYSSQYGLHFPTSTAVSPQAYLTQAPPSFRYGGPNDIYSTPPDSYLPPAPPVFSGTSFSNKTEPVQMHQASGDQQHTLHSNSAVPPTSSTPVYGPRTVPVYHGSHMYAQRPIPVKQPQIQHLRMAYQQDRSNYAPAMSMPQPSFTQTHQVRNVQIFSGGPDCRILIEDWIRDIQYLLDAGGMPANLGFATVVRHLSGEARRLVLNLPPNEQTTGRALEELRAEYSDMQTSLDPLADFYERFQRPGESACSYAIALEATLRSVEEAQYEGQPFIDRDCKLTRQFMRGLSDEEVYHRLAPMKPRLLSFRELQA
ncbi:transient receptor potential cation channel subfamily V member 5-like protein [Labeo rohita]|uniref:Transient receptor potential cation channel subfamily V member 5-like protein n=2 Tax=Labeo rohita TaxID=84645 RepID=A0A498LGB7_LABRO|nr:transient receptor potential cation channel subfamily V member 5-like protein [Labeo rohita]